MNKPLISVVMPTWNRGHIIANAIRSIMDQTYTNWELVILDDGSTDNTKRIVHDFAHPKIKYHYIEHQNNISKVRNMANSFATGEIIVVQDSDDISLPDRLEEIVKCYEDNPFAEVVYHGIYVPSEDPYSGAVAWAVHKAEPFDNDRILTEQYIPAQMAYKKEVWQKVQYNEEIPLMDDFAFIIELALNNIEFQRLDKNLYIYKIGADSINLTGEADGRRKKDTETLLRILKDKYGIIKNATITTHIIKK